MKKQVMSVKFNLILLLSGMFMLAASVPTQAALIGVSDHGTYFSDTQSGLDWLDVTASINRSYNDVSTQFGTGGDFAGWRYATAAEFGAMWDNITGETAGINGPVQNSTYERGTVIDDVIDLLGDTWHTGYMLTNGYPYCSESYDPCVEGDLRDTLGLLADTASPGGALHYRARILDDDRHEEGYVDYLDTGLSTLPTSTSNFYGSFLVRDTTPVPIPPAIALFASGLVGIGVLRRKIANRKAQL